MYAWGVPLFNETTQCPEDAPEIFVVGKQWMWEKSSTPMACAKSTNSTCPSTGPSKIHRPPVEGRDPRFRHPPLSAASFDVVPDRYVSTWYLPNKVGDYWIFCDQYCGQGHSQMVGRVYVMEQARLRRLGSTGQVKTKGRQVDGSPGVAGPATLPENSSASPATTNVYDADKNQPEHQQPGAEPRRALQVENSR